MSNKIDMDVHNIILILLRLARGGLNEYAKKSSPQQ
jgi:hypothetical protein